MFWNGKVIFLTGASSGIGYGLAVDLARRGAILGLLARRRENLTELQNSIAANGGTARTFAVDVTDAEAVQAAADDLQREFGRIDILIANAGIGTTADAKSLPAKDAARVININLIGAVNSVAAVVPGMVARGGGQLVAVSSLAAYRGLPKSAAYCASKAGMTALFESCRLDLQNTGVEVTIVHPGFIKTPLTAGRNARMPFLMELEDALPIIVRAVEQKKSNVAFPWQLALIVRLARLLPDDIYDVVARRSSFRE